MAIYLLIALIITYNLNCEVIYCQDERFIIVNILTKFCLTNAFSDNPEASNLKIFPSVETLFNKIIRKKPTRKNLLISTPAFS